MTTEPAVEKVADVIRRKHLALNTEHSYCAWLRRYCDFIKKLSSHLPAEQKLERFLTALAREGVAASTQNQAFNAIIFFYKEALGVELENIQALRARRPQRVRRAPTREQTLLLIKAVQAENDFVSNLVVRLLYGCGLRVTEALNKAQNYFGDLYRRWKARLGTPKAITAMAHKLARILWHLFKYREAFNPEVFRKAEARMQRKKLARLHNTAAALGLKLVPAL